MYRESPNDPPANRKTNPISVASKRSMPPSSTSRSASRGTPAKNEGEPGKGCRAKGDHFFAAKQWTASGNREYVRYPNRRGVRI
jgi:hypothetical protein